MCWISRISLLLGVVYGTLYVADAECEPAEFKCSNGRCVNIAWTCDGDDDCKDNSDEKECPSTTCSDGYFRCENGQCIPDRWVCDDTSECQDGSDETPKLCKNQTCEGYRCNNSNQCLPKEWRCDGQPDCPKKDDENEDCRIACDSQSEFQCRDNTCIPQRWRCDHSKDCDDGSDELDCPLLQCKEEEKMCSDGECLNGLWWCDGDADCKDKSDEANCTNKLADHVCGPTEFQCVLPQLEIQCIHQGWKCDDDPDCKDGSDETSCDGRTCNSEEKMCENHSCIKLEFFCDGDIDCENGEDERNCTYTAAQIGPCLDDEFDCGSKCIFGRKICDGTDDCGNGADEAKSLCPMDTNSTCKTNNGGCNQLCIPNPNMESGRKCECHIGFTFVSGSSTECGDINECETPGVCSQICINTKGSYKCECFTGYTLSNHRYCKVNDGNHPELILSDRHELRRYQLDTFHYSPLIDKEVSGAVAMDFDIRNKMVFWTDVQSEKVYWANLTTGESKIIIGSNIQMPDGLAVDWVHKNIYLSDTGLNTIEVARLDGSSRKTLIHDLDEPRALVVDPSNGWMYWTDWGSKPKIEKCGMNGQYRKAIVTKDISWPNGLTIDYVQQRLYWVDAKHHIIGSSDLDGHNYKLILKNHRNLGHPFAITVFEDYLYWTDWMTNAVHRVSKFGHDNVSTIALGLKTPMDIHVYHIFRQPSPVNHCRENYGGCSHLCLPVPQIKNHSYMTKQSVCACPDYMTLDESGFKCKQSDLAQTPKKPSQSNTDVTSPNRPQTNRPIIKSSIKPNDETTVIPVLKVEKTRHLAGVNTSQIETVIQQKEGSGYVAGIVIVILITFGLIVFVVAYLVLKRYKSRNVKSMNFDNPVYHKTTTDDYFTMYKN